MAAPTEFNTLLILFDGFNTLDCNGPYEVLRKSGRSEFFKQVTIASENETSTSVEGVTIQRNTPLDQTLIDSLAKYDLLIVPGGNATGPDSPVQQLASQPTRPFNQLIQAFASLPPPPSDSPQRILLSICTGATFLSRLNLFNNTACTTHWAFYDELATFNAEAAAAAGGDAKPGPVLAARYVDAGLNAHGVRIISSGGISCGMDAALHVVSMRCGEEEARGTAELLDYAWRKTNGVSFGGES